MTIVPLSFLYLFPSQMYKSKTEIPEKLNNSSEPSKHTTLLN